MSGTKVHKNPGEYQHSLTTIVIVTLAIIVTAWGAYAGLPLLELGGGRFKTVYGDASWRTTVIKARYEKEHFLEEVTEPLNNNFSLPYSIFVAFRDCDGKPELYRRDKRRVEICYERLERIASAIEEGSSFDERYIATKHAVTFLLYREIGRSLISSLNLPANSSDDALDQFAVWLLAEMSKSEGRLTPAIYGARYFYLQGKDGDGGALNQFYNINCLVYGADPSGHEEFGREPEVLPKDRVGLCASTYKQARDSWVGILKPYLRLNTSK